jgi:hypothetical protein
MKLPSLFHIHIQILLFLPYLAQCSQQQQPLLALPRLRNATLSDANAISEVVMAASEPLPSWQYMFQFRNSYPEEHVRCVRNQMVKLLENSSFHMEVIEAPAGSVGLMAIAIWSAGIESSQIISTGK